VLARLLYSSCKVNVHIAHQTKFTTSSVEYVGTDEEQAYEAYKEAENHATMESASASQTVIDAANPLLEEGSDIESFYTAISEAETNGIKDLKDAIHENVYREVVDDDQR